MEKKPNLIEGLRAGVLCGDGAMGTLLAERGIPAGNCFEELCLTRPEIILEIHSEYLRAGAGIITTNSFGANARKLCAYGLEASTVAINRKAAQLAREAIAASGSKAWVAGSVGPLGTHRGETGELHPEALFSSQITALLDGGSDLILLETFQDPEELLLALKVAKSLGSQPVITLLASPESGRLPDGAWIGDVLEMLGEQGADLVGLNCVNGPQAMLRLVEKIAPSRPLAVYPNAGRPTYQEGRIVYGTTPEYFADLGRRMGEAGAALVGGCCGTSPLHIKALSMALQGVLPVARKAKVTSISEEPPRQTKPLETSILDLIANGKTVIVTELDPPKTLPLEKFLTAAEALTRAGSDAITLADNSLAILRVSNFAVAAMLKQRGITPLLHLSCRDSNVIGLQSELLGMAAMGMRHVLALTGDPAKGGDHPDAT